MSGTETAVVARPSHTQLVAALAKPGSAILATLDAHKCHLWHMASCIPGEAGELFDAVKKMVIYNKPLDRNNVVEELGDLEFYLRGLRDALGITREETLEANIDKLVVRYGAQYSDAAAQARADKVPAAPQYLGERVTSTPLEAPPAPARVFMAQPAPVPHRRRDDGTTDAAEQPSTC